MPGPRLILDFLKRGAPRSYGPHRSQRADLHLPPGAGPHPVMVTIHGGSWQARYGRIVMRALAADLLRRGWAVWNIEYRRLGGGGGWPETFLDVAAAIDHLRSLQAPIDLDERDVLGHSAGGHLALWAASRERLPAGAPGAGPADRAAPRDRPGRRGRPRGRVRAVGRRRRAGADGRLAAGSARALRARRPDASSCRRRCPCCSCTAAPIATVSVRLSRSYAERAGAAGASVELVEIEGEAGGHRAHIDPRGSAWGAVTSRLALPALA